LGENIYYVTMKGESSFEQCSADVKKLFDKKQKCKPNENIDQADSCTFENIFIADVKSSKFLVKLKIDLNWFHIYFKINIINWKALSSFWYAVSNLNQLLNNTLDYDIDTFRNATIKLCDMNTSQVNMFT